MKIQIFNKNDGFLNGSKIDTRIGKAVFVALQSLHRAGASTMDSRPIEKAFTDDVREIYITKELAPSGTSHKAGDAIDIVCYPPHTMLYACAYLVTFLPVDVFMGVLNTAGQENLHLHIQYGNNTVNAELGYIQDGKERYAIIPLSPDKHDKNNFLIDKMIKGYYPPLMASGSAIQEVKDIFANPTLQKIQIRETKDIYKTITDTDDFYEWLKKHYKEILVGVAVVSGISLLTSVLNSVRSK